MATEREFHEATARCVSIMVYFHNVRRSATTRAAMTGEVRVVVDWITQSQPGADAIERRLFKAVGDELVARYDRSIVNRLIAEFSKAFKSEEAMPRPARPVGGAIRV